jgi:hypothetical protein
MAKLMVIPFIAVRLTQAALCVVYLPLGLVISLFEKLGNWLAGED